MKKQTVGLVEEIVIKGRGSVKTQALFDTGARTTSVDVKLAAKAKLGPVVKTSKVKNPSLKGHTKRPVVMAEIEVMGRKFKAEVNLQDRSHMSFPVLIGRNILAGNFLVDAEKNKEIFDERRKEVLMERAEQDIKDDISG